MAIGQRAPAPPKDYPVQPVPFTAVHFTDDFWAPRIKINTEVTIPFAFQQCETSGRFYNFERAAAALRGEEVKDKTPPGFPFDDTDVYKVLEGAAYTLSVKPDPEREKYLSGAIRKIAAAQEKDGYLYTTRTLSPESPHKWAGKERWENEEGGSHELYNLGHLYEAATAHYEATGDRSLLDVALKTANLLDSTFGPGKRIIWPGHQIPEMGLAKLYRLTGDQRYLNMAKFLLDVRGGEKGKPYNQSHAPVVMQDEAVGHAVRATYMYAGMADVAALTGDASYVKAIDRIWENVVGKKLYITGGIGAYGKDEAFGKNYELPNLTAYNETCAAIGNDYWNQRLFLLHGDARYIDVMERTLYNGLLSGVSLDGKGFFYPNPLESDGTHERSPWFGCACCPGNVTRFVASLPGYAYAKKQRSIYVNLFVAGNASLKLDDGTAVSVTQQTRYPWDGDVRITVNPEKDAKFTMFVRVPGWAVNQPVPSDLYRYVDVVKDPVVLRVNGKKIELKTEKGYAALTREWKKGDVVDLRLPMQPRRVLAHDAVEADRGRVAVERGPLVYAAEWPDNPGVKVRDAVLTDGVKLSARRRPDLLGGVTVIEAGKLTLIPYYAWANRGKGEMAVWLKRN
jgi:hypothetical protein